MYNSDVAASAIGVSRRHLDNFLRRQLSDLIPTGSQGRTRTIPHGAVERAAVALILMRDLGCRPGKAVTLATRLLDSPDAELTVGSLTTLRFDLGRLRLVLDQTLADAVETTPPARRGRPRRDGPAKKLRGAPEEAPRLGW